MARWGRGVVTDSGAHGPSRSMIFGHMSLARAREQKREDPRPRCRCRLATPGPIASRLTRKKGPTRGVNPPHMIDFRSESRDQSETPGDSDWSRSALVLLRHKRVLIIRRGWHGAMTARASRHESDEVQGEPEFQGCDGVGDVAFGSGWRNSVGPDLRKRQGPGRPGLRGVLRGERRPVRRPGIHRLRCTGPHGDGIRAIPGLRNGRAPAPV